jgi:hypothetical protein
VSWRRVVIGYFLYLLCLTVGSQLGSASAFAQSTGVTIGGANASGGTLSNGGGLILTGTIGQPTAGTLAGGPFTLVGGFWGPTLLPLAVADSYIAVQDTLLVIAAPGILANDSAPGGGQLTAVVGLVVPTGVLALAADGSFTYTPTPGFVGTDTFSYSAKAAGLTSLPATVTITVLSAGGGPGGGGGGPNPGATPELSSIGLFGSGLLALGGAAWRRVRGRTTRH